MNKLFTYLLITATGFLLACSSNTKYVGKNSSLTIDSTLAKNELAQNLIKPYKAKLDAEMNEVLVISSEEFPKERGKSQTKLGNLVADLSLEVAQKMYADSIDFCLLNFGGLRTSLPKGEITRGKIFELMPFENELVVVTINQDQFKNLTQYLFEVGGQPISKGITMVDYLDTHKHAWEYHILINENKYKENSEFKILTSDYLAKGGDNMTFFANPIKYEKVGIKLRDAIIQYCQEQNQQGKQLKGVIDNRLIIQSK